jgi:hypothetical protein
MASTEFPSVDPQSLDSQSLGSSSVLDVVPASSSPAPRTLSAAERLPAELLDQIFSELEYDGHLVSCVSVSQNWFPHAVRLLWGRNFISLTRHLERGSLAVALPMYRQSYADYIQKLWIEAHSLEAVELGIHLVQTLQFPRLERLVFVQDWLVSRYQQIDLMLGLELKVHQHLITPNLQAIEYSRGRETSYIDDYRPTRYPVVCGSLAAPSVVDQD